MSVKVMGVVWDSDLRPTERFVLLAYADHASHDGKNIFPSIESMVEKTGFSERTVQNATRKLEDKGWLIEDGEGSKGTNKWRIPLDDAKEMPPAGDAPPQTKTAKGASNSRGGADNARKPESPAPESSLTTIKYNHQEPSYTQPAQKEIERILRGMDDFFAEMSGHDIPSPKTASGKTAAAKEWWLPMRVILKMANYREHDAVALIQEAHGRLSKNGMTIAGPRSLVKTCKSIVADVRRGQFKPSGLTNEEVIDRWAADRWAEERRNA